MQSMQNHNRPKKSIWKKNPFDNSAEQDVSDVTLLTF
jgi:hypothetical protein